MADRTHTEWARYADAHKYAMRLYKSWSSSGVVFEIRRSTSYGRRWMIVASKERDGLDLRVPVRKTRRLSLTF